MTLLLRPSVFMRMTARRGWRKSLPRRRRGAPSTTRNVWRHGSPSRGKESGEGRGALVMRCCSSGLTTGPGLACRSRLTQVSCLGVFCRQPVVTTDGPAPVSVSPVGVSATAPLIDFIVSRGAIAGLRIAKESKAADVQGVGAHCVTPVGVRERSFPVRTEASPALLWLGAATGPPQGRGWRCSLSESLNSAVSGGHAYRRGAVVAVASAIVCHRPSIGLGDGGLIEQGGQGEGRARYPPPDVATGSGSEVAR